jgi:hypothetical protein
MSRSREDAGMRRIMHTLLPGAALALLASACAVGPNYVRPTTANPEHFKEAAPAAAEPPAPEAQWWRLFHDETLNGLELEVTVSNQTLAAAEAGAAVAREDFAAAMTAMARLRPAVDAFFDKVKVNDDDASVRENRLKLLSQIRAATRTVADSKGPRPVPLRPIAIPMPRKRPCSCARRWRLKPWLRCCERPSSASTPASRWTISEPCRPLSTTA